MLNIFNKIKRRAWSAWRLIYVNVRYIKSNYTIKNTKEKYAILNFQSKVKGEDFSRYFYTICTTLDYAGFNLIIKSSWRDFRTFKRPFDFKSLLLKQKYTFVRNCSTPLNSIVLVQPNTANHTIRLSYGYHLYLKLDDMLKSEQIDCVAPYPAYPMQFKFYLNSTHLSQLRKSDRTIKVFFAGSTDKSRYLSAKLEKFFTVIPRLDVINFIYSNFEVRKLETEQDEFILQKLLTSNSYHNEIVISQVKTDEEDWLKILSQVDFFICPPGARMPVCHNCVEAMSVGTIPILEYNDLFYPHLKDTKNCLSFKNYKELKMAITKALTMEPAEIETMRNNVIDYYNKYLSVDSILENIKTLTASPKQELKVAFPFISTNEEWLAVQSLHTSKELQDLRIVK